MGRVIVFNIGCLTFGNLYLPSGSDSTSKASREEYSAVTIPQLLMNRQDSGCIGGDFNCIIDKIDCTHHAAPKMSSSLSKLVKSFDMKDSFRSLYPSIKSFSHFYHTPLLGEGATRIDRAYSWGQIKVINAKYEPIAFSDHMAYTITISIPTSMARILSPRSKPHFKIKPDVIKDEVFQKRLKDSMLDWQEVQDLGLDVLTWWEILVKPGIKKLAIQRSKEINRERRGVLNLLLLRQAYLSKQLQLGRCSRLGELRAVQVEIIEWYEKESQKILLQARSDEISQSEKVSIYHHDLHKKNMKRSSILKLQTEKGLIEGHSQCASFLEDQVGDLLLNPAPLDQVARDILLDEIKPVFTDRDNAKFAALPNEKEVKDVLSSSNLLAAPGTDGIPSLLYHECWDTMKKPLTEVVKAIHQGENPTLSMRTSLMVFGSKPKKINSIKPGDKRRISLLNSDFKIVTGVDAKRFGSTATYSLSPLQLVAGSDRRIHHGINRARDAVQHAGKVKSGCGLLDLDFLAGFDWLDMAWVYLVIAKKGVDEEVINRIRRLYANSISVVVVNNVPGRAFKNIRGSLRQGDVPSMFWFGTGIDPLLYYLDMRLKGIPIITISVQGPTMENYPLATMKPMTEMFKLVAYADDVKPAITSMEEFNLVDRACTLMERASGVKLHRDPDSGKVKFLPLSRWRGTLSQEDLPCQYVRLSDHLDFVGVELRATYTQTRKANGDILQSRMKNTVGPWKGGRFMALTQRPFSANCYGLSKVWFKCGAVNLREGDIKSINSQVKSWLYQDLLLKPSELVLYRQPEDGGLGLFNVKFRALALLIRTFLETATNPNFQHSLYHEVLYRYHVLDEHTLTDPGLPPYYDKAFFSIIRHYKETGTLNISTMTIKQWYQVLMEDKVLMHQPTQDSPPALIPVRCETLIANSDWKKTWQLVRVKGLGSELASFLFKLVHGLLPTQDRVARLGLANGDLVGTCLHCRLDPEDLLHCFFGCTKSMVTSLSLLGWIQHLVPHLSPEAALCLELRQELSEMEELAVVCTLATGLKYIWEVRLAKKAVVTYKMRAEIEAKISILRRSRYVMAGEIMETMLDN